MIKRGLKAAYSLCAVLTVLAAVFFCSAVCKADAAEEVWGRTYYSWDDWVDWSMDGMVSDMRLESDSYSLGSQQNVTILFNNSELPDPNNSSIYDYMTFWIVDEFGAVLEGSEKQAYAYEMTVGSNSVVIPYRFTERGVYYVKVLEGGDWEDNALSFRFTVKKATNDKGESVDIRDYIATKYPVYSKAQAKNLKLSYSVSDISSDYRMYIRRGVSEDRYADDREFIISEYQSAFDEMEMKLGETCTLKTDAVFDKFGVYTAVLYNSTVNTKVAEQIFYIIPEKYVLQRDISNMTDTGIVPLTVEADKYNLDLGADKKIKFEVGFPINYQEYLEELKLTYYYSWDDGYMDDRDEAINDIDDAFLTDDYSAFMRVYYTPEYSKESRLLFTREIKGMYKNHEVEISSEELTDAIYSTGNRSDVGYAGKVTVEFSNETDSSGYMMIVNDAIVRFTEDFSFGVSKSEKIKSAKALASSFERAYGESAAFTVTDTLGGKIYVSIYKGSKKIATVDGKCLLNSNGTATGTVYWNLKKSGGSYAAAGSYKAKIYTVNEYPEFDKNGKSSTKKVKSKVKTVSFKLKNPTSGLTVNSSAAGSDGDNSVYLENPVIGIQTTVSVGSKLSVQIKNSNGTVLKSASYESGKGTSTYSFILSGLGSKLKAGTYKATVTAKTLDGKTKSSNASFTVKNLPKASISGASVSTDTSSGTGSLSFKVSQSCDVTVAIKSGSATKDTLISQHYSAGTIKTSFSIGSLPVGTYNIVITASNSGGTSTLTKSFEVKKKPVVVKKPAASALSIRYSTGKDGDTYKCSFNYTGKGAKVVIDIMYNDTEDIVFTYEGTTKSESGTFSYTWDGFKSNGFKAWTGSYTVRVRLVNSAGCTDYLRQNFTIGEG